MSFSTFLKKKIDRIVPTISYIYLDCNHPKMLAHLSMLKKYTVGVIGAGNMGEALIRGMLNSEQTVPVRIVASSRNAAKLRRLKTLYGIRTTNFNSAVVDICDIVLLAVKPQDMADVCTEIAPHLKREQLVISIAAGITLKKLHRILGAKAKLVRAMPNTPALIDYGVTAIFASPSVKENEMQLAEEIFGAVGISFRIAKEKDMDPITALSGTGPAYVYEIIDSLTCAGKKLGLNEQLAKELVMHTIIGAAKMVMQTGEDPKELWKKVASKRGTTVAAFDVLRKRNFSKILQDAVRAAANRSRELGRIK